MITINNQQKRILLLITYAMLVLGIVLLRGYLMLIIFAAIMATLFTPIYDRIIKRGRSKGKASFYTFVISTLFVIIPISFVALITFYQLQHLVNTIAEGNYSVNITDLANQVVETVNNIMVKIGSDYRLTLEELTNSIYTAAVAFGEVLFTGLINTFAGIFGLITAAIIYIYVFLSMLVNKDKILETFRKLNPLGDEISDIYLARAGAMTKATVRGQFIIAFMQGLASAVVLALVGPEGLFFFWLILLTLMSVIPLGAGIITIPIGIIMILTGNVTGGILVIANHLIIVTNIDNVMRPKLVPKSARLDPALMILAVFSGLALFGFLGIVIGPIIMILVVTTVQIFTEVFYKEESIDRSKETPKESTYAKIKGKLHSKKA